MSPKQETSLWTSIRKTFSSVKLTIVLLIILAIASILGTFIPQDLQTATRLYSQGTFRLLNSLELFDLYHSWWFITLLFLLCFNLVICSLERLPRVWKLIQSVDPQWKDSRLNRTSFSHSMNLANPPVKPEEVIRSITRSLNRSHGEILACLIALAAGFELIARLRHVSIIWDILIIGSALVSIIFFIYTRFQQPIVTPHDQGVDIFFNRGRYSRLGAYIVHVSILIIFLGGLVGNLLGFEGYVEIAEGESKESIWLRGEDIEIPLGFQIRCDDFEFTTYPGTQRPKDYKSKLAIIDRGQEVTLSRQNGVPLPYKIIEVNDPLTYKGITFYQSSYGAAADSAVKLRVNDPNGEEVETYSVNVKERVSLPDSELSFFVFRIEQNPDGMGPGVQIALFQPGQHPGFFWIFNNFPELDERRKGQFVFTLLDVEEKFFTGLQVAKDPGISLVWFGCGLMMLGLAIAFFWSHRRVWIRLSGDQLMIAALTNKQPAAFSKAFDRLVQFLQPFAEK